MDGNGVYIEDGDHVSISGAAQVNWGDSIHWCVSESACKLSFEDATDDTLD